MKDSITCISCGGIAVRSTTTAKYIVNDNILSIHNIPCYYCSQCGEVMYLFSIAEKIEGIRKKYTDIKTNKHIYFT